MDDRLSAPQTLTAEHDLSHFDCGEPGINAWLALRAWSWHQKGWTTVWVACQGNRVVGFYTLSSLSLIRKEKPLPGRLLSNAPAHIPAMLLGQLGVDQASKGQGLAKALVRHALDQVLLVSKLAGVAVVVVDLLDESLRPFYEGQLDFKPTKSGSLRLYVEVAALADGKKPLE